MSSLQKGKRYTLGDVVVIVERVTVCSATVRPWTRRKDKRTGRTRIFLGDPTQISTHSELEEVTA